MYLMLDSSYEWSTPVRLFDDAVTARVAAEAYAKTAQLSTQEILVVPFDDEGRPLKDKTMRLLRPQSGKPFIWEP